MGVGFFFRDFMVNLWEKFPLPDVCWLSKATLLSNVDPHHQHIITNLTRGLPHWLLERALEGSGNPLGPEGPPPPTL